MRRLFRKASRCHRASKNCAIMGKASKLDLANRYFTNEIGHQIRQGHTEGKDTQRSNILITIRVLLRVPFSTRFKVFAVNTSYFIRLDPNKLDLLNSVHNFPAPETRSWFFGACGYFSDLSLFRPSDLWGRCQTQIPESQERELAADRLAPPC